MKTFQQYIDLKEDNAMAFGKELIGNQTLQPNEAAALKELITAFEEAIMTNYSGVVSTLSRLSNHDQESLNKLKSLAIRAIKKIMPEDGLANQSPEQAMPSNSDNVS